MEVVTILPTPEKVVINVTHSTFLKEHINCTKHMLIYGMELASQAKRNHTKSQFIYEGWNSNFGNAAVTFDTAHLQSSYFHRPSMYSPELCRTRSQP